MFAKKTPYPFFDDKEFRTEVSLEQFTQQLTQDGFRADGESIKSLNGLNTLISSPQFFLRWSAVQRFQESLAKVKQDDVLAQYISIVNDLPENMRYDEIGRKAQKAVGTLNRRLLELSYPKKCPKRSRVLDEILETLDAVIFAFVFALIIRAFLFQPYKIPSGSMRMTLIEKDHLFVNKLRYGPRFIPLLRVPKFLQGVVGKPYFDGTEKKDTLEFPGFGKPERGDVIVFVAPHDREKDFIKRLIAFGGETVEIRDGNVYVNDKLVKEPRISEHYYYNLGRYGAPGQKVMVPEGHVFVMGDNSRNSQDSRYWGFVPEDYIVGRAEVIFWPPKRMRVIN